MREKQIKNTSVFGQERDLNLNLLYQSCPAVSQSHNLIKQPLYLRVAKQLSKMVGIQQVGKASVVQLMSSDVFPTFPSSRFQLFLISAVLGDNQAVNQIINNSFIIISKDSNHVLHQQFFVVNFCLLCVNFLKFLKLSFGCFQILTRFIEFSFSFFYALNNKIYLIQMIIHDTKVVCCSQLIKAFQNNLISFFHTIQPQFCILKLFGYI